MSGQIIEPVDSSQENSTKNPDGYAQIEADTNHSSDMGQQENNLSQEKALPQEKNLPSPEDYEKLEKNYKELRELMSRTRKINPPDTYEMNIDKELGDIKIDENDELLVKFKKYAKENNLSQGQFDSILNFHLRNSKKAQDIAQQEKQEFEQLLEKETEETVKELGYQNKDQAKEDLKRFLMNHGLRDLDKEIDAMLLDPIAIKAVAMLRKNMDIGVPTPSTQDNIRLDSEYFMKMRQDPRYLKNIEFTRKVDEKFKEAVEKGWL